MVRKSHIAAIRQIFKLKRAELDRYFQEVWLPTFATKYFQGEGIAEARQWVAKCPTLSAAELLAAEKQANRKINCDAEFIEFLLRSAPILQQELEQNRLLIVAPLNDLESALVQRIEDKYTEVAAVNNSITTFLTSAAEVVAARDRYLAKVGVTDEKVDNVVDNISTLVDDYLSKAKGVEEAAGEAKNFVDKAKALTGSLK